MIKVFLVDKFLVIITVAEVRKTVRKIRPISNDMVTDC